MTTIERRALCFVVLGSIFAVGCDKDAPSSADAAATDSASASGAPASTSAAPANAPANATGTAEPAQAPDDLDRATLQKALKCGADPKSGVCAIVAKFATCTPWDASPPSGDGRWLGKGYLVEADKPKPAVVVLRARRVPSNEVAPGQLPVKVAVGEIEKKEGAAHDLADRAIRILERQDVPPRFNATFDYVKKRSDWTEAFATRTASGQVYLISKAGAFICLGPKRELLLVQRTATRGASADGLYAELWATTW